MASKTLICEGVPASKTASWLGLAVRERRFAGRCPGHPRLDQTRHGCRQRPGEGRVCRENPMHRLLWIVLTTALSAPLAVPALAQSYPTHPVTIVVPFAAGGGSDLLARLVAQHLETRLGKPFVIENRPGAATSLAAMQVVRSAPDGYTLMQATSSTMAINVSMSKKLPYEP